MPSRARDIADLAVWLLIGAGVLWGVGLCAVRLWVDLTGV